MPDTQLIDFSKGEALTIGVEFQRRIFLAGWLAAQESGPQANETEARWSAIEGTDD